MKKTGRLRTLCLSCLMMYSMLNVHAQSSENRQAGGGMPRNWIPYFRYDKAVPDSVTFRQTVAKFKQLTYQDQETGMTLAYNLFVPKNYDASREYPLLLFMHDASVTGREVTATLTQGLGAVVWASDYEQEKHPCFVLAPQFATVIADNRSEMTPALETTVNLIEQLQQHYSIDADRIYTTGQSGGCMGSIAINIKYPELFAGSYLCSGQWNPMLTAPLAKQNVFICVAEGDMRAYPGMNAITAFLETQGATVTKEYASARCSDELLDFKVKDMLRKHTNVNYLVLSDVVPEALNGMGGAPDHMCSWLTTYSIESIRDWLFSQRKGVSWGYKLRDKDNKEVLLAADKGDWHGTSENTLRAIEKAVEKGAAIVPVDVQLTKDGELVLFTDDSLNRLMYIGGEPQYVKNLTLKELRHYAYRKNGPDPFTDKEIPTLAEAVSFAQGKIVLLIKNAALYIDKVATTVKRLGAENMVVVGGMTEPMDTQGLMAMPFVDLDAENALERLDALLLQKPVAVELRFAHADNALLAQSMQRTLAVCRVAFDISQVGRAGHFCDKKPGEVSEKVYAPMIETGATIFITNEVKPFSRYLKENSQSVGEQ